MIINKIYRIFFLITFCLVLVGTTTGCSFAKGRFIELDFTQEDNNQPVKLNEEEIFFPGGWNGSNTKKIIPAKVYNIRTKKLSSLNATMNFPRSGYGAIKYDDNNILIAGGSCIGKSGYLSRNCSNISEIYNIKDNKYNKINNLKYSFNDKGKFFIKDDNSILLVSSAGIQLFDFNKKEFIGIYKFNKNINKTINLDAINLDANKIFIWGALFQKDNNGIFTEEKKLNYIYNISNNYIKNTAIDCLQIYNTAIYLKNNILFWGGDKLKGNLSILYSTNEEIKNIGFTDFGTSKSSGLLLKNGEILLTGGCIDSGDYFTGKYLIHAILNPETQKLYRVKTTSKSLHETFMIPINNNIIFITGYSNMKPMLYKY